MSETIVKALEKAADEIINMTPEEFLKNANGTMDGEVCQFLMKNRAYTNRGGNTMTITRATEYAEIWLNENNDQE